MSGLYLSGAGKKFFVPIIETALPDQGTLLERNFFPEAGKPLSRNYRDFAGAAWALSRISLMPDLDYFKQQHPTFSKIHEFPENFSKLSLKIFSNSRTILSPSDFNVRNISFEISRQPPLKSL